MGRRTRPTCQECGFQGEAGHWHPEDVFWCETEERWAEMKLVSVEDPDEAYEKWRDSDPS
jgi:hypothetical protein